tara:strand:- start:5651 stop:8350 length:2700 start_codon:yes stop_codon:yes gene_type:complete
MAFTITYAVGSFNRVVKQIEHNGTWIDIAPNVNPDTVWKDVMTSPINPEHVCIVGDVIDGGSLLDSGILISTDAGATWAVPFGNWATHAPLTKFLEVWFVDSQNIWAVGNNGWVVKSQNGGITFQQPGTIGLIESGTWAGTACIYAINSQIAVVAGSSVDTGTAINSRVWKTINGGNTWTTLNQSPNYYTEPLAPNLRNAWSWAVSEGQDGIPFGLLLLTGGTGYFAGTGVSALSNGTGKDLTLDITTTAGAVTAATINNAGRDFNVGEIVTVSTGAGDATFEVTYIEPTYPIGIPRGIWMSKDENTIVVSTLNTQQTSIDGGQNFITTGSEQMLRAGVHLTWYPSHEWQSGLPTQMRHVGGIGLGPEVIETLNIGSTWSTTRQNTSVHMVGAHFYSPQNGYYTHTNKLYRTSNGGVTGIETYNDLGFPTWEAVWTEEPTIIYKLIDCSGQANDQFVSDPNMANYVGQIIQIVSPDEDLPADLCWLVEEYEDFHLTYDDPVPVLGSFATCLECDPNYYELIDCEGNETSIYTTTDLSTYIPTSIDGGAKAVGLAIIMTPCCGGTIIQSAFIPIEQPLWSLESPLPDVVIYNDGIEEACYSITTGAIPWTIVQPPGYIEMPLDSEITTLNATDCNEAASENPICICDTVEPIMVGGNVIQIEACPGVCWTVNEIPPDPTLTLTVVVVTDDFIDCEDCLPKALPPAIIIRNRKVKPGYDTPGCPPEYVEKINCAFAEVLFKEVAAKRYGITICCEEDENKYLISKYLMDLKAIFDPNACKSILPDTCCPPCAVSSILIVHQIMDCMPPLNVTSELSYPIPCLPPYNIESQLIQAAKCTQFNISVPELTIASVEWTDCNGGPRLTEYTAYKLAKEYTLCALDIPAPIVINCTIITTGICLPK